MSQLGWRPPAPPSASPGNNVDQSTPHEGWNDPRSLSPLSQEPVMSAIDGFVIESKPVAHFGVGAIDQLPGVIRATGAD